MLPQQHHMLATKPLSCGLWGAFQGQTMTERWWDVVVEQVHPGEPLNGPEGKAGLKQDHHETDSGSGLLGPVSGMEFGWPPPWYTTLSVRTSSQFFLSQGTKAEWAGG